MVERFGSSLSRAEREWWYAIPDRSINVLNQNIRLMPAPDRIAALRSMADTVTITTAHQKYCTREFRDRYGVPLHKLSVWISPEQYMYRSWAEKENLLVYSPDQHPDKEAVIGAAPTMGRFKPRAKGSAGPIIRRSSHISITLTGSAPEKKQKPARKAAASKTEETPAAAEDKA